VSGGIKIPPNVLRNSILETSRRSCPMLWSAEPQFRAELGFRTPKDGHGTNPQVKDGGRVSLTNQQPCRCPLLRNNDRGRKGALSRASPPFDPDMRFSRIRLSSRWSYRRAD
jgi:hypothetical protein